MIERCLARLFPMLRWMARAALLAPFCVGAQESCETGVVFGFFNGVQTTEQHAKIAVHDYLAVLYGPTTPNDQSITYELFYNDTQGFADFVETFEQRLQEQNGLLAGRFELFFSAIKGEGGWWNALTSAIPSLTALLGSFFDAYTAAAIKGLASGIGDPNMGEVSARHQAQINHWASLNQKMLFLAHSQGNLFVNKAYTHAVGTSGAEYVRVVHVAPASPALSGHHSLADKDLVINGLRLVGTVAANTDLIPGYLQRPPGLNGERDLVGHGLLEIYLNPALLTAGRIRGDVLTALQELDSAPRRPMPPFPAYVPEPPTFGPRPSAVFSPVVTSYTLDRIVEQGSDAVPWIKGEDRVWRWREWLPGERAVSGWSSSHYFGSGMGGYAQCTWGEYALEGWAEPQYSKECIEERIPVQYVGHGRFPEELNAYSDAPIGTVMFLNTMTFRIPIQWWVHERNTPNAHIKFQSSVLPHWYNVVQDLREWQEPYTETGGVLLNANELQAWSAAEQAYLVAEFDRHEKYLEALNEYERKRLLCEASR